MQEIAIYGSGLLVFKVCGFGKKRPKRLTNRLVNASQCVKSQYQAM
jgi:hypothetical protein